MKTRLILVRHAQAEGNFLREFHGWTDSGITELGHQQAALAAKRLKEIRMDVLYSSTMKRALETARYISKEKELPILRTDQLKEINGGAWEGVKFDQLPQRWPKEHDTWENKPHLHQMPNGESVKEFQERLIKEMESIIAANPGKTICIVTHGTAIKSLMCYFQACDLAEMVKIPWYDNTSLTILEHEEGRFTTLMEGDASHLGKEFSTLQNQDWFEEYLEKIMRFLRGAKRLPYLLKSLIAMWEPIYFPLK